MGTAVVIFALYPLAPPRLLPEYGMTDIVVMMGLNPVEKSDSAFSYNKFAAMPSLHIAWSVLITLAWFKVGWKPAKVISSVYLGLMTLAVIATANHYVLDVFAGVLLLVFAVWVIDLPLKVRRMLEDRDFRHLKPAWVSAFPETGYRSAYYQSTPSAAGPLPVGGPPESTYWDFAR
jgi:hypothetical protein